MGVPFTSKSHDSLRLMPSSTGLEFKQDFYKPQPRRKYPGVEYEYEEVDVCNARRARTPIISNSTHRSDNYLTPYSSPFNNVATTSAVGHMNFSCLNIYSAPSLPILSPSEYQVYRDPPQSPASTKEDELAGSSEDGPSNTLDGSPIMTGSLDELEDVIPDLKLLDISNDRSTCSFSQVGSTIIASETTPLSSMASVISYSTNNYHRQPTRPKDSAISTFKVGITSRSCPASSVPKLKPRLQLNDATMMFAPENAQNVELKPSMLIPSINARSANSSPSVRNLIWTPQHNIEELLGVDGVEAFVPEEQSKTQLMRYSIPKEPETLSRTKDSISSNTLSTEDLQNTLFGR